MDTAYPNTYREDPFKDDVYQSKQGLERDFSNSLSRGLLKTQNTQQVFQDDKDKLNVSHSARSLNERSE